MQHQSTLRNLSAQVPSQEEQQTALSEAATALRLAAATLPFDSRLRGPMLRVAGAITLSLPGRHLRSV